MSHGGEQHDAYKLKEEQVDHLHRPFTTGIDEALVTVMSVAYCWNRSRHEVDRWYILSEYCLILEFNRLNAMALLDSVDSDPKAREDVYA